MSTIGVPPADARRVCAVADLQNLQKRIVHNGRRNVLLCRTGDGRYFAVGNSCPHQGASLCGGTLGGTAMANGVGRYEYALDGEVLRCPWHGWEFDVKSGVALAADSSARIATYEVTIFDGHVYVARGATPRR